MLTRQLLPASNSCRNVRFKFKLELEARSGSGDNRRPDLTRRHDQGHSAPNHRLTTAAAIALLARAVGVCGHARTDQAVRRQNRRIDRPAHRQLQRDHRTDRLEVAKKPAAARNKANALKAKQHIAHKKAKANTLIEQRQSQPRQGRHRKRHPRFRRSNPPRSEASRRLLQSRPGLARSRREPTARLKDLEQTVEARQEAIRLRSRR